MSFKLYLGPMFSGKTTTLLREIRRFKTLNKNILIINHSMDDRFGPPEELNTHDKDKFEGCLSTKKLMSLIKSNNYLTADIIIIEEVQFFQDAFEFITNATDIHSKTVLAAGLSGDFKRKPFKAISELIPIANEIEMLYALCKKCGDGTPAQFSKRKESKSNVKVLIGGDDLYEAVCRYHYLNE